MEIKDSLDYTPPTSAPSLFLEPDNLQSTPDDALQSEVSPERHFRPAGSLCAWSALSETARGYGMFVKDL